MSDFENSGPMSLGMRVDALVEQIDSMPSAYLYALTVMTSVAISLLLTNAGGATSNHDIPRSVSEQGPKKIEKSCEETPQPRWYILKMTNYAAFIGFVVSVLTFTSNASEYLNDSYTLMKFLSMWALFLCYFFGFFGISLVDAEVLEQRTGLYEAKKEAMKAKAKMDHAPSKRRNADVKLVQPPASSIHPVCGTPNSKSFPQKETSLTKEKLDTMSNEDVAKLVLSNTIKDHTLEKLFDPFRAVEIRRLAFDIKLADVGNAGALLDLPCTPSLDYGRVFGANCEIVVGYVPIPVGMVGPLTLNGQSVYIPMATTEGCLVASTNRGCKAISSGSGAFSTILKDGITRAPCLRMSSAEEAANVALWCRETHNFLLLKQAFESTTSFGKLLGAEPTVAGRNVYLRLRCFSGDAMGMNMVSKGSLAVVDLLREKFPSLSLIALSGNMCTDKKAAATNWIEGRGKSVVIEATIPKSVVKSTLKTDVPTIVSTSVQKNLIGSAMAGCLGGFNAHAANNVTAVFLATGQDPAQNVESSNCLTLLEETPEGDLWISCTMPSIEVGTVGGGTSLPAQSACLRAIGCKGGGKIPGENAKQLAHVVAGATMAGELSLLAALASNSLVSAHMQHNRKPTVKK